MSKNALFDFTNVDLTFHVDENIAILKIGKKVFDDVTDLDKKKQILSFYDSIEKDSSIKALLVINENGSYDEVAYSKFMGKISGEDIDFSNPSIMSECYRKTSLPREINFLHDIIRRTVDFNKIIIEALQGTVVTPFFGVSLSADLRFATKSMRFSLAHLKYGLHPSGALAFFLPRYIGQGKAVELLLRGGYISADKALKLGLINKIVSQDNFERKCINEAKRICRIDANLIKRTRVLTNYFKKELESYFKIEHGFIIEHR